MHLLVQHHLKALTVTAALILSATAGFLPMVSAAFGCEGVMVETKNEDETTKEEKGKFSPRVGVDETWGQTWTVKNAPVEVKASIFSILKGNLWEEGVKCAARVYLPGETCLTTFLIKCLLVGELLAAEQEIKLTGKLPATGLYVATCLK